MMWRRREINRLALDLPPNLSFSAFPLDRSIGREEKVIDDAIVPFDWIIVQESEQKNMDGWMESGMKT